MKEHDGFSRRNKLDYDFASKERGAKKRRRRAVRRTARLILSGGRPRRCRHPVEL